MQTHAGRLALKVAVTYLIVAGAWILFSDELVEKWIINPDDRTHLSIIKGWAFVLLTAGLLHQVLRRLLRQWEREAEARQATAEILRHTERALRTLSACNQVLVRADTEPALLTEICRVIVEKGGYRMAWVGFAENDEKKSVRIAAHAGYNEGYLEQLQITWADTEWGRGPTGQAIRTGRLAACHDFQADPKGAPWRIEATKRGYASSIVLPLRQAEKTFGVLTLYSAAINDFNATEIALLNELADDLAYGLTTLRARAEHQQAAAALLQSELDLRAMAESMPQIVWACQPDGLNTYFNQQWVDYTGMTMAESHGTGWTQPFHPEDRQRAWDAWQNTTQNDVPYALECRLRRADGTYRWWLIRGVPQRNAQGKILKWFGTCTDIEAIKQAEMNLQAALSEAQRCQAALEQSETRFRQMVACVADVLYGVDGQTHEFTYLSPAFERMLGYTAADVARRGGREKFLAEVIQGGHFELQRDGFQQLESGPTAASTLWQAWWRCQDGSLKFIEDLSIPVYVAGRLQSTYGVLRDMTRRKQVEEALRHSEVVLREGQRLAHLGNWEWNTVTDGHFWSPEIYHIYGRDPELGPAHVAEVAKYFTPESWARLNAAVEQGLKQGSAYECDAEVVRPDGTHRWVTARGEVARDADGKVTGLRGTVQDITERKQAEAALRFHQVILEETGQIAKVGGWTIDTVTGEGFWTDEVARIHDLEPGTPINKEIGFTYYLGESRTKIEAAVKAAIEQAVPYDLELEILSAKGIRKWVHTIGHPETVAGRVVRLHGSFQDITSLKQAEAAMRDSEQKYRGLFESSLDAILTVAPASSNFISGNPAAMKMFGVKNEAELVAQSPVSLSPERQPDGRLSAEKAREMIEIVMLQGSHFFEWTHRRMSGEEFFADVLLTRIEREGKIEVMATVRDITERVKKTEELHWQTALLEAQLEATLDGILVVDKHGRKIIQNQHMKELWKIPAAIADNPADAVQIEFVMSRTKNPRLFVDKITHLNAHTDEVSQDEIELLDGTILDRYSSPVRDQAGNYYGRIWTFHDITKSRILEAQLRQAQKMDAIGTLAGGIAHDFNNILAAIFGYSHLLQQDTEGNTAAQQDLAEILKAANRAKDLVQQILTFSRQREQKREVIRLDSVVKEATKFLRASLPAEIKIEIQLDPNAPAVLADPTQIYQVTMNLATNALHAMEGRPGRLAVSLEAFRPDENFRQAHPAFRPIPYARLTVVDTGQGMDAPTLERIFDPFFTTKPAGKGTGLGLSVVHGIVRSHEGLITVGSQVGHGTTFSLYFPAQTEPDPAATVPASQAATGSGQHILLLDDEPALTAAFQRLLERLKYRVTSSNRAREALGWFHDDPARFDLVLTDLAMPEMNGLEVAREIHVRRPELPVILMSGFTTELTPDKLRAAGIGELLEKPVSLPALADALQRVLTKA